MAIGAIAESIWATAQTTYDTMVAWTVAMSLRVAEPLEFEGGDFEWTESNEKNPSGGLETEIKGKRSGTWTAKCYVKPRAVGTPTDDYQLRRHGYGRMEADLTVLDYSVGGTDTVTLYVDTTAVAIVETTDFTAATDNGTTAAAIQVQLAADVLAAGYTDVTVSVVGSVVTAVSDGHSLRFTTDDAAAWAPTSIRYRFSNTNPDGLQIMRHLGNATDGFAHEVISGAWVETMEIEQAGNEPGMITYSGGFARKGFLLGKPQTDTAGYSSSDTVITLASGDEGKVSDLVYVQFVRDSDGTVEDNSSAGYLVDSYDTTAGTITLAGGGLAGALSGAAWNIQPFVPSHSVGGTIQGGIANDLSIASTSIATESAKISITTGVKGTGNEIGSDRVTQITRGKKKRVEVEAEWLADDANAANVGLGWNGSVRSFALRQGPATAGQRVTTTCPATRLSIAKLDVPDEEEVKMTATGKARINSTGNDEIVEEWN